MVIPFIAFSFVSFVLNHDVDKSLGGKEMRAYARFKNEVPFKAELGGGDLTLGSAAPLAEVP